MAAQKSHKHHSKHIFYPEATLEHKLRLITYPVASVQPFIYPKAIAQHESGLVIYIEPSIGGTA